MTWLGVRDHRVGWYAPSANLASEHDCQDQLGSLRKGTLLLEAKLSAVTKPQTLFSISRNWPATGHFSIKALSHGGIIVVDALGDDICHATLPFEATGRIDVIRLSFSWDENRNLGYVSLEEPESDRLITVEFPRPVGFQHRDLKRAFFGEGNGKWQKDTVFAAVSDRIEPVGPMPSLTGRTPICTPDGDAPVSELRRGDHVLTERGETAPVLQIVRRTVPAKGSFRPIRLRAPYFDLSRDIVIAPEQKLIMRGSQVEYMFGREAVLVPACHLLNDISAFKANGPETVTYYHVLLAGHQSILASGASIESLYIGRIRRKPDALARSVLSKFDQKLLPEHATPVWPVLKSYEAISLAMIRAA